VASPFPATWFGGYTGGWAGYIPTPEEFPAPAMKSTSRPSPTQPPELSRKERSMPSLTFTDPAIDSTVHSTNP